MSQYGNFSTGYDIQDTSLKDFRIGLTNGQLTLPIGTELRAWGR